MWTIWLVPADSNQRVPRGRRHLARLRDVLTFRQDCGAPRGALPKHGSPRTVEVAGVYPRYIFSLTCSYPVRAGTCRRPRESSGRQPDRRGWLAGCGRMMCRAGRACQMQRFAIASAHREKSGFESPTPTWASRSIGRTLPLPPPRLPDHRSGSGAEDFLPRADAESPVRAGPNQWRWDSSAWSRATLPGYRRAAFLAPPPGGQPGGR